MIAGQVLTVPKLEFIHRGPVFWWASEPPAALGYVLVVDDDRPLAGIVRLVLEQYGFEAAVAHDGDSAIGMALDRRPDAIVLDLRLPGKDGRTIFCELRDLGVSSPVIILSAYDARRASVELGAQAAMNKPFDPVDLAAQLEQLIANDRDS